MPIFFTDIIPALVQIIVWCQPGSKPLSESMMVRLPMHRSHDLNELIKQAPVVSYHLLLNNSHLSLSDIGNMAV